MESYTYSKRDRDWAAGQGPAPHDTTPLPRTGPAGHGPQASSARQTGSGFDPERQPGPGYDYGQQPDYGYDPQMGYEEFFWGEGTEAPRKRRGGGCCSIVFALLVCVALLGLVLPQAPINQELLRGASLHHLETWLEDTFGIRLPEPAQEQLEAIYAQDAQAEDGYFVAQPPTSIATTDEARSYYRSALSGHAASVYDDVLEGLQGQEEEIALPLFTSPEELEAVWQFVLYDHPEIFYLPNDARVTYWEWAGNVVRIQPSYKYAADEAQRLAAEYEELALELPLLADTQAATMENICAYVADTTDYVSSGNDQYIDSVFSYHESVCAGYAKAVQYLALRHGIPCVYLTGTAQDVLNTGGSHAWLAALVDGKVRYYDPTWYDQLGWHADQFLGMNLVEISADHTPDYPQLLPR